MSSILKFRLEKSQAVHESDFGATDMLPRYQPFLAEGTIVCSKSKAAIAADVAFCILT